MADDCVFCDKSKFEERLVAETKDSWIIATLGQITDGGYVLLVPKEHIQCSGAMKPADIACMASLVLKTREILYKEYNRVSLVFEHGIVGQTVKHAHLHVFPENLHISDRIFKDFPQSCQSQFTDLQEITSLYARINQPYLLWKQYGFQWHAAWNPPAPPQYLRTVTAEAIGRPERGNWRNMDPELDKKLGTETVLRLKKYF